MLVVKYLRAKSSSITTVNNNMESLNFCVAYYIKITYFLANSRIQYMHIHSTTFIKYNNKYQYQFRNNTNTQDALNNFYSQIVVSGLGRTTRRKT